jgi:DNA end-binding protein Ku
MPAKKRVDPEKGLAPGSTRALWKGAISFGLVHIPVALHSATSESDLDFDWLDRRTMDPVGYKRINKKTGREIASADIVKGIEFEDGQYVILSNEEIAAAFPKTTQTIEIEAFIEAGELPFLYLEKPYYIAPINRGERVYALLREVLVQTGRVGVARVVISTKQHLAVLIPSGPALVLNLLRWGGEIRSLEGLKLPPAGVKAAGLKASELAMGKQLVKELSAPWSAERFRDSFQEEVLRLVASKAKAGDVAQVTPLEKPGPEASTNVVDLTELLKRSLKGRAAPAPAAKKKSAPAAKKAAPAAKKKAVAQKAAPRRRAA